MSLSNITRELLKETHPELILYDGFEDAFLGVGERVGFEPVAVYDYDKCVDILCERDRMSVAEAREFIDFNVVGQYVGERTPIIVTSYQ